MVQMQFISMESLKEQLGVAEIDIVETQKEGGIVTVWGLHAKGTVKVQQDIDASKPIRYMYEEGNFSDGCIVNVKTLAVKFRL